jgi:hypothetical protein
MAIKYQAIKLFPDIYRIDDFLNQEHPVHHPASVSYAKYWSKQEEYCIVGKWGLDKDENTGEGGWRYMPPNLYFYINMWKILHADEKSKARRMISPKLRDVEWMLSYGWLTSRGFSGFQDDPEYTSHRDVLKYAKNFFVLGSRGFGKSFYCAGAVIGHEFLFDGHKRYNDQYLYKPNTIEIFLGSALSDKSSQLVSMVQMGFRELPGAYGEGDDYVPSPFFKHCSGVLTPNNKQNPYRHKYKERIGNTWVERGTLSAIYHGIYTTENPQAAVGGRYTVMVIEEVGLASNLLSIHGANETCQTEGINKFGSSFYIGTGGNIEKITESKMIFSDPESYDMVGYEDVFEKRAKPIGFFMPAYYALNQYKDHLGNTDIESAFNYLENIREVKRKASTSMAINEEMMARPFVPSEMFLTKENTIFPIELLRERLAELEMKDLWKARASIGWLEYTDNTKRAVTWREDFSRTQVKPISTINLDAYQGNIEGGIVIYEHPPDEIPSPTYGRSLYKICYDPVKDDKFGTSLASIIVHKGFSDESWEGGLQDCIVAEYIGRLDKVDDIHEIAIKLSLYFNAKVMVENNIPDFIRYCKRNNKWHILQPSPYIAISKAIKNPGRKYDVGITMTAQLNTHCEQLLRQWLLQPYGVEDELRTNVDKFFSIRMLEEMLSYSREANFDHVSSLKLLALWLSQESEEPITQRAHKDRYQELNSYMKSLKRDKRAQLQKQLYYGW